MKIKKINSIIFDILSFYDRISGSIIKRNKTLRQFILCLIDCFFIIFALILTIYFIDDGQLIYSKYSYLFITILGIFIYISSGQYKELTKYIRTSSVSSFNIILRNTFNLSFFNSFIFIQFK